MKKKILVLVLCLCCGTVFASNWLNKVADTVNTVNDIVNPEQAVKISIANLNSSGTKYINKTVQVSGKVMGMAVSNDKEFVVFLKDGNAKLQIKTKNKLYCKLLDTITVTGMYDGKELVNSIISN